MPQSPQATVYGRPSDVVLRMQAKEDTRHQPSATEVAKYARSAALQSA